MTYSDDMLRAYLLGEATQDVCDGIEQAVETDADLEARLMALDPFATLVADAFESAPADARLAETETLLAEMQTAPVASNVTWFRPSLAGLAVAAAGVAGFFIATATIQPEPSPELTWRQQAALYQALYVPETIANLDGSEAVVAEQIARAEGVLSTTLDQNGLSELQGLELKRAQVLAFGDKPLIQIAYAGPNGVPFALCIFRRGADKPDQAVSSAVLSGMAAANWAQGEFAYMLIGGTDNGFVERAAQQLTDVL